MSHNGVSVQFISFTMTKILFTNNDNDNKNKEMRRGSTFGQGSLQIQLVSIHNRDRKVQRV